MVSTEDTEIRLMFIKFLHHSHRPLEVRSVQGRLPFPVHHQLHVLLQDGAIHNRLSHRLRLRHPSLIQMIAWMIVTEYVI